jgi:hypothetical protein
VQRSVELAFGNIDLSVGASISHQASEAPSVKIIAFSDCALTNAMRSGV